VAPHVAVAVLSLAAVAGGEGASRAEPTRPVLTLVWFDPSDLASGSDAVARAEVARLLARMGAAASWRRGTPGEIHPGDGVRVVMVGEGPTASDGLILGATHRRHAVWVRVPNVRAAIGITRSRPQRELPAGDLRLVGVALGRVITHEVVHAVVPSLPHGTGLMSESLGLRQLTAASIPIDPEVGRALRAALAGSPTPPGAVMLAAGAAPPKDR
jgi:hypothetical protein